MEVLTALIYLQWVNIIFSIQMSDELHMLERASGIIYRAQKALHMCWGVKIWLKLHSS